MNLFLVGYRGSGKSTIAHLVAERLDWGWLDTDVEIERRAGKTIAEIFADEGEPAFRDRESRVLEDVSQRSKLVLALGGGIVLAEQNRHCLKTRGRTAWLMAKPETLWRRISADSSTAQRRPNLTTGGGLAEVEAILAARTPLYRQCADWVVDTEGRTPAEVAGEIESLFRQSSAVDLA
jgi:shikimate kinase